MCLYTFWMSLFAHAMARRTTGIAVGSWRSCATATHIRCAPSCWSPAPGGGVPRDTVWTHQLHYGKCGTQEIGEEITWKTREMDHFKTCILISYTVCQFVNVCEMSSLQTNIGFSNHGLSQWNLFVESICNLTAVCPRPSRWSSRRPVHPKVTQNPPTMHI